MLFKKTVLERLRSEIWVAKMPHVVLPEKYYLGHFNELRAYLKATSLHLLNSEQLERFCALDALSEDALCLLVRLFNRKSQFFDIDTIVYHEISDIKASLKELTASGWLVDVNAGHCADFVSGLNKSQLQALAVELELDHQVAKSAKKDVWLTLLSEHGAPALVQNTLLAKQFVALSAQYDFDYWQFLYFGSNSLQSNQFSLRDMGIVATRETVPNAQQARFDDIHTAQFAFNLSLWSSQSKLNTQSMLEALAERVLASYDLLEQVSDSTLHERYHHLLLRLASKLESFAPKLAKACFETSNHPKALEKRIRLLHQGGEINACQALLNEVLAAPDNEELLLFAEDFWQRKFNQKRTSTLTDILRASAQPIAVDEAFRNHVEQGVCEHYQRFGATAIHTENQLWRVLFGLVFWQELYANPKAGIFNAFQRTPQVLKDGLFYQKMAAEIETRLAQFTTVNDVEKWLVAMATRHFGEPNTLFYWSATLLDAVLPFLHNASLDTVLHFLREMTKDFRKLRDGYPDLLVIEDNKVRFEEIKAPGDVLRRNQLVTINALSQAGFNVRVQATTWQMDPNQPYVVVDLETTGGKAQTDRITEIAIVTVVKGEIVDSWSSLVNPERHIPRFITGLTGISNDMVKNAPTFEQLADIVSDKLAQGIFVAHNVNFDYGFLKQSFMRMDRALQRPKLCTVQLGRKFLPGHSSYSLGKLCAELDIELNNHHRALSDATATAHLLNLINAARIEHYGESKSI